MAIAFDERVVAPWRAPAAIVQRVTEGLALRTWFATLLESVEVTPSDEELELATNVFVKVSDDPASGWYFYLARIDGRAVGTSALHLGTAAGLHSVGTLPSLRRPGHRHRALGAGPDRRAVGGYAIATLTGSELGARLYGALGFKEYCRYREYVWRPRVVPR